MTGRERILATIEGRPVDRLAVMPITMMFAADQVGAPYRAYATDHRVLVEGQLRTAERFDIDHVSAISDPAREAADCGAAVHYFDNQPPSLDESRPLLADRADLARLRRPRPDGGGRMTDRIEGVRLLRQKVGADKLVEGWVEGPCAEAADLRGISTLMLDFMDDEAFVHDLFAFCVEMAGEFAEAQIQAGADLIGVGDAAASLVGPAIYEQFVLPHERRLVERIHAAGGRVRLHICGNSRAILAAAATLGCDIVDIDFLVPMDAARALTGPGQVLLGNLDPVRSLRDGTPQRIARETAECHRAAGQRFIVGAGCEVPRDTPPEHLRAMLDYARQAGGTGTP